MERKNGKIISSTEEHNEFDVPLEMDLESAVELAAAFADAARKTWRHAETKKEAADDSNSRALLEAHQDQSRAVRLNMYAAGILKLCPDIIEKRKQQR